MILLVAKNLERNGKPIELRLQLGEPLIKGRDFLEHSAPVTRIIVQTQALLDNDRIGSTMVQPPASLQQSISPEVVPVPDRVFEGVLEVFIDQRGSVTDARLQSSILPRYDADLMKVARTWKFTPAMRNGTPVPYVKVMQIRLTQATRYVRCR